MDPDGNLALTPTFCRLLEARQALPTAITVEVSKFYDFSLAGGEGTDTMNGEVTCNRVDYQHEFYLDAANIPEESFALAVSPVFPLCAAARLFSRSDLLAETTITETVVYSEASGLGTVSYDTPFRLRIEFHSLFTDQFRFVGRADSFDGDEAYTEWLIVGHPRKWDELISRGPYVIIEDITAAHEETGETVKIGDITWTFTVF
jgi:hypothetical protein